MDRQKQLSLYGKLLGDPVASLGGKARARSLTPKRRKEIAIKAANARWSERESIMLSTEVTKAFPKLARMHAENKIIEQKHLEASINKPIRFSA